MTRSGFEAPPNGLAVGYVLKDDNLDRTTADEVNKNGVGYKVPSGGLFTDGEDMAKFLTFLMGGGPDTVLPKQELQANYGLALSSSLESFVVYAVMVGKSTREQIRAVRGMANSGIMFHLCPAFPVLRPHRFPGNLIAGVTSSWCYRRVFLPTYRYCDFCGDLPLGFRILNPIFFSLRLIGVRLSSLLSYSRSPFYCALINSHGWAHSCRAHRGN